MSASDDEIRAFVNDENHFKNIVAILDDEEGSAYVDRILPLLDPEKIAFLLSKDERIVDKVYALSHEPGPIQEVVQTIYEAKTNQSLVNKLDGNALLKGLGFDDYEAFWFNSAASEDDLAELCAEKDAKTKTYDVLDDTKRAAFLGRLKAGLHWNVPKDEVYPLLTAFAYTVCAKPDEMEPIWARVYNYLAAQLKHHEIEVNGLSDLYSEVVKRLPDARDIGYCKPYNEPPPFDAKSVMDEMKKREEERRKSSAMGMSGMITMTGMSMSIGSSYWVSGSTVPILTRSSWTILNASGSI